MVGMADLNGDHSTDLVFQNRVTGDIAYWLMDGDMATNIGYISPKNPGVNWNIVGIADFNEDGYKDILFQNIVSGDMYVWYMQGVKLISGAHLVPKNPGSDWKVAAVGDLNTDGQPDILFQQKSTGDLYYWLMHHDTVFASDYMTPANPGAGWNITGLADINGDGQSDLLFQRESDGMLAYWLLDYQTMFYIGLPTPFDPGSADWKLVGPR
jgi:hypothetical protein